MLQGLSNFCGHMNPGGLLLVEYIPTAWIQKSTKVNHLVDGAHKIIDAPNIGAKSWLKMYVLPEKREWDDNINTSEHGASFTRKLDFVTPVHSTQMAVEIQNMKQYRYILRVKDRVGNSHLLGTESEPFIFSAGFRNGANGANQQSYILSFQAKPINAPFRYDF